jgi:transcriptional regulator with XRE-family HTH domain
LVDFLIARRDAAGITQSHLARRLGEYQSFVARLERGQRRIDVNEFLELTELLEFDPARAIRLLERVG